MKNINSLVIKDSVLLKYTPFENDEVVIPEEIVEIASNAIIENNNQVAFWVVLNSNLKKLNDNWSKRADNEMGITNVSNIPSSLEYIGKNALPVFFGFKYLNNKDFNRKLMSNQWTNFVVLPYNLEYLSFRSFDKLKCVGDRVLFTKDGVNVNCFDYFNNKADDFLTTEGRNYKIKYTDNNDSVLYSKDGKKLICFFSHNGKSSTERLVIDEPVEEIEAEAFRGAKVNEIVFPASLKKIGPMQFDFSRLKQVVFMGPPPSYGSMSSIAKMSVFTGLAMNSGQKKIKIVYKNK